LSQLEKYLSEYDYFSGRASSLDREKLEFHSDFIKARSLYEDNMMIFPSNSARKAGLKEPISSLEPGGASA
jgi:hypothetical protein